MRPALLLVLLSIAGIVPAARASACSIDASYRVPTNLELVQQSPTIVLGIAEGHVPGADEYDLGEIIVRPVELLKGPSLPPELRIEGSLSDDPKLVVASDPRDLYAPNPGALMGGCTRYIFKRGMLLLLFLERDDQGALRLAGFPFARSAEDVPSAKAPWAKAVRFYIEITALPAAQRRSALIARRDALRAATDDPDAALLAADIDRQLRRRRIPPRD